MGHINKTSYIFAKPVFIFHRCPSKHVQKPPYGGIMRQHLRNGFDSLRKKREGECRTETETHALYFCFILLTSRDK